MPSDLGREEGFVQIRAHHFVPNARARVGHRELGHRLVAVPRHDAQLDAAARVGRALSIASAAFFSRLSSTCSIRIGSTIERRQARCAT